MADQIIDRINKFYSDYTPYQVIYEGDTGAGLPVTLVDVKGTLPGANEVKQPGYSVYSKKIKGYKPLSRIQLNKIMNQVVEDDPYYTTESNISGYSQTVNNTEGFHINKGYGWSSFKTELVESGELSLDDFIEHMKENKEIHLTKVFSSRITKALLKHNIYANGHYCTYSKGMRARRKRAKKYAKSVYFPTGKIRCHAGLWKVAGLLHRCVQNKVIGDTGIGVWAVFCYTKWGNSKDGMTLEVLKYLKLCNNMKIKKFRRTKVWKDFMQGIERCIRAEGNTYGTISNNLKVIYKMETGKEYKEEKKK